MAGGSVKFQAPPKVKVEEEVEDTGPYGNTAKVVSLYRLSHSGLQIFCVSDSDHLSVT
jgi:hypothetical protein